MKAIVYTRYGPPDVLELKDVKKPVPRNKEVLIRIRATTVTSEDCSFRKGDPFISRALVTGLVKPKNPILGIYLAGDIEDVGKNVKRFKAGDRVYGNTPGFGANAEYKCLPEEGALAIMPANMTYEEAAAVCGGVLTALPFLRDSGNIRSGQEVLVFGASGSVGSSAVQLAKCFGADVTGICSGANVDWIRSLGADQVVDYTREDFTGSGRVYDIIFDAVGKISFLHCRKSLKPRGLYLTTVPSITILLQMLWTSIVGGKKARIMFTGMRPFSQKAKDLVFLKDLVESGKIKAVIDRRYPLERVAEAHRYVEKGHKKGNVVVTVS